MILESIGEDAKVTRANILILDIFTIEGNLFILNGFVLAIYLINGEGGAFQHSYPKLCNPRNGPSVF